MVLMVLPVGMATVLTSATGKPASCNQVVQSGFTFLEMLVVMLILALVGTTVVALSPDAVNDKNQLNKVAAFINGVRDQAIFSRRTCGVQITIEALQGVCWMQTQWQKIESPRPLKMDSLLPDTLTIDQQKQALVSVEVVIDPQLIFLSDGRGKPFNWTFGLSEQSHVLQGDMLGYLNAR